MQMVLPSMSSRPLIAREYLSPALAEAGTLVHVKGVIDPKLTCGKGDKHAHQCYVMSIWVGIDMPNHT